MAFRAHLKEEHGPDSMLAGGKVLHFGSCLDTWAAFREIFRDFLNLILLICTSPRCQVQELKGLPT